MNQADRQPSPNDAAIPLRMRADLALQPMQFGRRMFWSVKDPLSHRFYQLREEEYFLLQRLGDLLSSGLPGLLGLGLGSQVELELPALDGDAAGSSQPAPGRRDPGSETRAAARRSDCMPPVIELDELSVRFGSLEALSGFERQFFVPSVWALGPQRCGQDDADPQPARLSPAELRFGPGAWPMMCAATCDRRERSSATCRSATASSPA